MSQSLPAVNRFFLRPQYSIYYRRLRRFQWLADGVCDYGVLFLLDGQVKFETEAGTDTLRVHQALVFAPGRTVKATGSDVELLLVSFAPAFIVDYAVRARLVSGGSAPTFSPNAIIQDKRLAQLLTDLAD